MPLQAKTRRVTPRRRTPIVAPRRSHSSPLRVGAKSRHTKKSHVVAEVKVHNPATGSGFKSALRFLETLTDYERLRIVRYNTQNFDLDRMRHLLKKLGNPQEHYKSVHIAGTKGKGSTCAMIANMLQANGYKVGLYTSPHLVDIRERIQVNGEMISHADFSRLMRLVEPIVARARPMPTFFDVMTAVAFKYFAEQKIEIAVVETGLGGRLDSTNVIKPEVTGVTSISKDHMAQLGHTLPKIAEEKAGIFKPGVPAITVTQAPEVEAVLKRHAEKVGAPFDITGKSMEFSYRFEATRMLGPHNRICLTTPNSKFEHLAVPMMGEHQAINCGLALAIIDKLKSRGFNINDSKAMEGLSKTSMPGRLEIISTQPRVLVDGAHNAASLDALMKAISQPIPYDSMVVIFGCCADKDIPGMLERITSGADKVIFTKVDSIRTANPDELAARYVELYGKMAQVARSLDEALE